MRAPSEEENPHQLFATQLAVIAQRYARHTNRPMGMESRHQQKCRCHAATIRKVERVSLCCYTQREKQFLGDMTLDVKVACFIGSK